MTMKLGICQQNILYLHNSFRHLGDDFEKFKDSNFPVFLFDISLVKDKTVVSVFIQGSPFHWQASPFVVLFLLSMCRESL